MKSFVLASLIASAAAFVPASNNAGVSTTALSETKADLEVLGKQLNPVIGYFDPLSIADSNYWGFSTERSIGWLRQSEIKHGRVAMMAFVGYCVQSNFLFPWKTVGGDVSFEGLNPPQQWDAMPLAAKVQIVLFVGFLELYSEIPGDEPHYTKGGKPGAFPTFDKVPHYTPLNYFDPFDFSKNASEEKKAKGLVKEINNGRLAMIGIMGMVSEAEVPGSVPLLKGIISPYAGEVMAPF